MRAIAVLAALTMFAAAESNAQSFDCNKATSAAARLICSDGELKDADSTLGAAFKKVLTTKASDKKGSFQDEQLKWIRARNKKCHLTDYNKPVEELAGSKECLLAAIRERIAILVGKSTSASHVPESESQDGSVDISRLTAGAYVDKAVPCERASNATVMNFDGKVFTASRFCPAPVTGLKGSKLVIRRDCPDKSGNGTREKVDTVVIVSPTEIVWRNSIGVWKMRLCESASSESQQLSRANSSTIKVQFHCTSNYENYFWASGESTQKDAQRFAYRGATIEFLNEVRRRGIEFCGKERAAGRCCGPSAYPNNIVVQINTGPNVVQLIGTSGLTSEWKINSLPEKQRLAAEQAQQKAEEDRRTIVAQEKARKEFSSKSGDPISGVWKSRRSTLVIQKEGMLYMVTVEGDCTLRGEHAGPYKDSQIQLGGVVGNISVVESSAELIFCGDRFKKARE